MRTLFLLTAVTMVAVACGGKSTDSGNGQAKSDPPSALVAVTAVHEQPISSTLNAYGTVEFSPEGARVISAEGQEVVTRMQVAVGQEVGKGDALLTIAPSSEAQLQLDKLKSDVQFSRKEVDRLVGLRSRALATNADVQAARQNLASLAGQLSNLEKRQGGAGAQIVRADVVGVVQTVSVQLGQIVAQGAPLVTIGDANHTRVKLGVEQDDLTRLRPGQTVAVSALNSAHAPIAGRIFKIFRHVDATTRLASAVVPLPPGHGLLPGAMVRAQIVVEEHPHALVVPRSAVLYDQKQPYLFVDDHGQSRRRQVETGIDDGKLIEITGGVAVGDRVVVTGNAQLSDGMAVRTEPPQ
jgi:membrane fusion protein (multidrug efflux system)